MVDHPGGWGGVAKYARGPLCGVFCAIAVPTQPRSLLATVALILTFEASDAIQAHRTREAIRG